VALKRIRREAPTIEERERLRREASAAARLSHPAVVRIYDLVEDAAGDALVFEYVEGRTLRELLQEGLPSPALAARLGREIAEGLAAAHATGLVYRDLKAENVMVTPDRACIRVSTPGCGRWDTAKKTFSRIRGAATGCRTPGTDPALSQTARGN
jgi:serine/threonine protein kinase